jgi:tRNA(Arg) A34 adenosine deaminase TadA
MIETAIREALKSDALTTEHRARHGVLITKGGSVILARGYNRDRIHAEMAALARMVHSDRARRLVAWSVRLTPEGQLAMARPCPACLDSLYLAGVRKVWYTDNRGELRLLRLRTGGVTIEVN